MRILNLTQHAATEEQVSAGVVEPCPAVKQEVKNLLTIENIPSGEEIRSRVAELATIALEDFHLRGGGVSAITHQPLPGGVIRIGEELELYLRHFAVMIGGAPYLRGPLEGALQEHGLRAVYAFSQRKSAENTDAEGRVTKVTTFRHLGFVEGIGGTTYPSRAARILSHFVDNCPSLEY